VSVALERRAAALAVDVAKGNDRVGRVVDLESLPVDARRGAVAVAGTARIPESLQGRCQPICPIFHAASSKTEVLTDPGQCADRCCSARCRGRSC